MNTRTAITLSQICDRFHIDLVLVRDFADFGLYPTVCHEGELWVETRNLSTLKNIISLHQALGINKEGIEVILDLRRTVSALQDEVERLQIEVKTMKHHAKCEEEDLRNRGLLIEIDG